MAISWIIVGILTFIYCYYWYRRPKNSPLGPRGIPIFGIAPFLGKYPERKLRKWSKSYGPIMATRLGTEDFVSLNNYDVIAQALVKQSNALSGRPRIKLIDELTKGYGILFLDYGDMWKSQRKFGLMTLRGFGVGKKSLESRIVEEVDYLNDFIRSQKENPFDISNLLRNVASNTICSILLGRRFEYDDPWFKKMMQTLFERLSNPVTSGMFALLLLAPTLRYVPPFSFYSKLFAKDVTALTELLSEIVKEHEDTFDEKELRDFTDAFIQKKRNGDSYFSEYQLEFYVRDLFFAGTETTSSTLNWSLLCLLHYPQTQIKLREEIMEVIGANGKISLYKKNEMPYTNAFIQEIYRFRTIVPLSVFHMTNEDIEIGGYFVEKGTPILPNIWAVHNDPELWDEPEKFKPERFIDEKGNFVASNHVIPFGVGPRHCLGEQLARMEVFILLVGMVQKFEFLADHSADQLPDIERGSNGPVFVPMPYKIVAKQI